jgi:CheY-like chemotaxis protein
MSPDITGRNTPALSIQDLANLQQLLRSELNWFILLPEVDMEKIRIIIADDHAVVREGTRTLLEREEDMEVIGEARDGEEAVKIIEKYKPDVAILDISMPKLSGIEVTKQVKSRLPSTAILIYSAMKMMNIFSLCLKPSGRLPS